MNRFHFVSPTEIFFGKHCVRQHGEIFTRLGNRAYIITTEFPDGVKNEALEDVKAVLEENNIEYIVDYDAQPDPPVESIVAIQQKTEAFSPDFLIGVGGGSAMDTAKAVNVLMKHHGQDPYWVLFDNGPHVFGVGAPHKGKLPIISVPTTAGTGSDLTGVSVVTRNDIQSKSGTNRRSYARYAFVDSRYLASAPRGLNQATAMDALCHGIEIYISRDSRNDPMTDMLIETAFRYFAPIKENLLHHTMTEDDYEKQAMHSMLQGLVIVNELTGVPHGMGYPLSYYYHVPHGLACAMFEGEYLRIFQQDPKVKRILELLEFETIDDLCAYIQSILDENVDIQVTHEQIDEWTQTSLDTKWRVDRHPCEITWDMVHGIYTRALAKYIID